MSTKITNFTHYVMTTMMISLYTLILVGITCWAFQLDGDNLASLLGILSVAAMIIAGIVGKIKDSKEV